VIDEAHAILEQSTSQDVNSDLYIAKTQLEKIFNSLIREFRSKRLGFILSDVTPSDLFTAATKLPSIKILFCMGETSIRRFTHMVEDHKYLLLLRHRHALVLDGNNANRYSMKTATIEKKALPDKITI
jgi:DNA helicase HerA-like ATPase